MLGVPLKLRRAFPVSMRAFISWTTEFGHCDQETFCSNGIFEFESSRFVQNPNSIVPELFESSLLLHFPFKSRMSQRGLLNFCATSTLPTKSTDCFSNCLQKHNQQTLRSDLLIISFFWDFEFNCIKSTNLPTFSTNFPLRVDLYGLPLLRLRLLHYYSAPCRTVQR